MDPDNGAFAELGLAGTASEREIKAAWRRLVSQWHPDRNASAEAVVRMQRINRAFDAIREAGFTEPPDWTPFTQTPPGGDGAPQTGEPAAASTDAAGGHETGADDAGATPPGPIGRRVRLTLEQAAFGCVKVLRGRLRQGCGACGGTGQGPAVRCDVCDGTGQVRPHFFGWPGAARACAACQGSGQVPQACPACAGCGTVQSSYHVKVRIPAGVRPGDQLHVPRRRAGTRAPPADLEIDVQWLPHSFFTLDEDGTVRCELPVDGFVWLAEREAQVPTLAGMQPLALRRDRLRYVLPGQGFPPRQGAPGPRPDQVVVLRPVFPPATSEEQRLLLERLIATTRADPPPELRAWQRRMAARTRGRGAGDEG